MPKLRLWVFLIVFLAGFRFGLWAAELLASWSGDQIRISAPGVHFLAGKALDDLKNGAKVTYAFELTLAGAARDSVIQRSYERFAVSYDLWEEKYAVSRLRNSRSVSNLSAAQAEAWCLEAMELPSAGIAPDRPLWLRLDIRIEEHRARDPVKGEPGINLARLIELFSQPRPSHQPGWQVENGPFQLKELRKNGARGTG